MPGALAAMEASTSYRPPAEVVGSCTAACCAAELAGKSTSSGAFVGSGRAMETAGALCCACCCCGSRDDAADNATGAALLCSMGLPGSILPPCATAAGPTAALEEGWDSVFTGGGGLYSAAEAAEAAGPPSMGWLPGAAMPGSSLTSGADADACT